MTTIRDVAKHAGVTPAVISRIINNDKSLSVKDSTRQRVIDAIAELNYRPNPVARSLRCNSSSMLGMIVPDIANPFFVDIIKGAQKAALEKNYCLIIINTDEETETETKSIEVLSRQKVDGILNLSSHLDLLSTQVMKQHKLPFVLVNRNTVESNTSFVGLDNVAGAYLAVEHLIALGHRKIAHISGPLHTDTGIGRLQGYRKMLMRNGIMYDANYCVESSYSYDGGFMAVQQLCLLENRPSAIFAANDLIAMGAIAGAAAHSIRVPEDISIIGFNDIWTAAHFMPPLTTIRFDNYAMGYEACTMLINKIENMQQSSNMLILEPQLIIRKSTTSYSPI